MTGLLVAALVASTSLYLVGLGVAAFVAPALAARFLLGHAGSAFVHYLELLIRLAVGLAFLQQAPDMRFSAVFIAFGWVLVSTTLVLVVVPWRWHQSFAQRSVPQALRHLKLIGLGSLALGSFVAIALVLGAS
jgi:uncharacterized protein YjeT (DUF2065 family)